MPGFFYERVTGVNKGVNRVFFMVLARGFGFADAIGDALMLVGYVRTILEGNWLGLGWGRWIRWIAVMALPRY